MPVARRGFVTLDCSEPAELAAFWAAMLGGEVAFTTPQAVGVRTSWTWLAAMKVADYRPPTWPEPDVPKQIHLDLDVDDLPAAVAEARRLGAREAAHQPAPDVRRIMLDPAGHPFCLTTQIPAAARASMG
jgi:nucleotide-binding universal stress UspA family protein